MSDLESTGPATGETLVAAPQGEDVATLILPPQGNEGETVIAKPEVATAIAGEGEVVLVVEGPWAISQFDPSIDGCPVISKNGTAVPAEFADQAVSIGAANGVSIVKR